MIYIYVNPSKIQHAPFHENPPQNNSPAQPQETTVTEPSRASLNASRHHGEVIRPNGWDTHGTPQVSPSSGL